MLAIYTSEFDDKDVICRSECRYDETTMTVTDVEVAENSEEADDCNMLTDEYVTLPNGKILRESDGVIFDYYR